MFTRWRNWANMTINVDKCYSFGMEKVGLVSRKVNPKLHLNNEYVHPIEIGDSFYYLGHYFDFEMTSNEHKKWLTNNCMNSYKVFISYIGTRQIKYLLINTTSYQKYRGI